MPRRLNQLRSRFPPRICFQFYLPARPKGQWLHFCLLRSQSLRPCHEQPLSDFLCHYQFPSLSPRPVARGKNRGLATCQCRVNWLDHLLMPLSSTSMVRCQTSRLWQSLRAVPLNMSNSLKIHQHHTVLRRLLFIPFMGEDRTIHAEIPSEFPCCLSHCEWASRNHISSFVCHFEWHQDTSPNVDTDAQASTFANTADAFPNKKIHPGADSPSDYDPNRTGTGPCDVSCGQNLPPGRKDLLTGLLDSQIAPIKRPGV
jgi:hypothetical protein